MDEHRAAERRPLFRIGSDSEDSGSDSSEEDWRPRAEAVGAVMDGMPWGPFHRRIVALFCLAQTGFCTWVLLPVFINPLLENTTALTEHQLALCSTAFFGGWAAATPLLAQIADRHGRRRVGLVYYGLGIIVGIRVAFTTSFAALLATRTILGGARRARALVPRLLHLYPSRPLAAPMLTQIELGGRWHIAGLCGGAAAVNYVWCTELLPSARVPAVTAVISSAFAFGVVLVALVAYLILDTPTQSPADVAVLGCAVAVLPTVYFALAARSLPETPAWLVSAGKPQDAADIVARIAQENHSRAHLPVQPYVLVGPAGVLTGASKAAAGTTGVQSSSTSRLPQAAVSLWRGELFRQLLALSFTWFAVTVAYYGLAFQAGSLPGSVYVTASVMSLADIPGNGLYFLLAERQTVRCGQRQMQGSLFFIGAVVLLAIGVIGGGANRDGVDETAPSDGAGGSALVTGAAVFGKVMMAAAFNGVYVFVVDIFPVEVKGEAMGVCNVAARVGGMLAPLVAELSVRLASTAFGLLALGAAITTLRVLSTGGGDSEQPRPSDQAEAAAAAQP